METNGYNLDALIELAQKNNAIIATDAPGVMKSIYPNIKFVDFRDTIHHVFNRPVYVLNLTKYLKCVCKDISGYKEEEEIRLWDK